MALKTRAPIIGLFDAGGARIQEGVAALGGYGEVFQRNVLASGVIPQISRHHGPVRRRRRLFAGDDRLHLHGARHQLHVRHRPRRGEDRHQRDGDRRGTRRRQRPHDADPSIADGAYDNDVEALLQMRRLIDFLPANNQRRRARDGRRFDDAERVDMSLDTLIPDNPNKPYDIKELILKVVDEGDFFEIQDDVRARTSSPASAASRAARSASSPTSRWCSPACSTCDASRKAARFVRFCDCFNIPIVTFVDVPGFLPGTAQEYGGLIKHGAKLLFAYRQATVPKVTVITRKAFGGAYDVMASKHICARRELCLADRADRGDGRQGRGRDHLPRRTSATPTRSPRAPRNTRSASCRPSSPPSAAISTT